MTSLQKFTIGTQEFEYCVDAENPLEHMSVVERIGVYCAFLNMIASGNIDADLQEYSEYLSLRLRYEDDPLYGFKCIDRESQIYSRDSGTGLLSKSLEEHVELQLVHSMLGENDAVVYYGLEHGLKEMWRAYNDAELPAVRTSLFQIYWAKGTDVRRWASTEIPTILTDKILSMMHQVKDGKRDRWSIMEASNYFYGWMKENSQQNRMKYSVKDTFLDLALCFPDIIDPESFLEPGTGCKRGLATIFGKILGGKNWNKNVEICYNEISSHPDYPLKSYKMIRDEAMICYHMDKSLKIKTNRIKKRKKQR